MTRVVKDKTQGLLVDQARAIHLDLPFDQPILARGLAEAIAATRNLVADGLDPRVKSLNYLNRIMTRLQADFAELVARESAIPVALSL